VEGGAREARARAAQDELVAGRHLVGEHLPHREGAHEDAMRT
jgi:hypothetical protein